MRASSILPLGKINLTSGKSKYFNVFETWGEDTTYELYKTDDNKLKLVATSGKVAINKIGQEKSFRHDQTFKHMFRGEMIDSAVGTDLKKFAEKYNVKSITGATYK